MSKIIESDDEYVYLKFRITKEEKAILDNTKTMFSTQTQAIRHAIWLLQQRYIDQLTGELKPKYKKIAKEVATHKCYVTSPEMTKAKMNFRDSHKFMNMVNYSYKLLSIYGIEAQKPILENIQNMKKYFVGKAIKNKTKEFEYKIKNHFSLVYDNFLEVKAHNLNAIKQHSKHMDFSDVPLPNVVKKGEHETKKPDTDTKNYEKLVKNKRNVEELKKIKKIFHF